MTIPIPDNLKELAEALRAAGVPMYYVGGLVRNTLLGLPPSDVDACGPATPAQLIAACERAGVRVVPKAVQYAYRRHTA